MPLDEKAGALWDVGVESAPETGGASDAVSEIVCDVVIAGCGVAGLYTALNLPSDTRIVMLSKGPLEECDSMLAQGGICVLRDRSDYASYLEDTMRAGHYENRYESVDIMIRSSRRVIDDLVERGVRFEQDPDGELVYTREGAHSSPRICFHEDITGREITSVLQRDVKRLSNVTILENTPMIDIIESQEAVGAYAEPIHVSCAGIIACDPDGNKIRILATSTVLATGGIGGLYEHSTNYPNLQGDACRIARDHGVSLQDMDYVQIHPTSLYTGRPGRAFLISESCRGEGAILLNGSGKRFIDELQPRDVVSRAIFAEMEREGSEHVWLSFERISEEEIRSHFPHIYEECLKEGYDITKEPIPVVPAQHYFMGGIHVDKDGQTSMDSLYAVGETACTGVHGKNRLASNSLLEALVFAQRVAHRISTGESLPDDGFDGTGERCLLDNSFYKNDYSAIALEAIIGIGR